MSRFKKLRDRLDQSFTFLFIPDASHHIRKFKLKVPVFYISLVFSSVALLALITGLTWSVWTGTGLQAKNSVLERQLAEKNDRIARLEELYTMKNAELETIEQKVDVIATYYDTRLSEISSLEEQVRTMISKLNQENSVALAPPISRSFDRGGSDPTATLLSDSGMSALDDLMAMVSSDEISELLSEQQEEYTSLITDLEDTLDFLEYKPDFTPVNGRITSGFGLRRDPITGRRSMHKGLDIANDRGTPILAAGSGVVTYSGYNGAYGRIVVLSHGYGYKTVYAHNNKNLVKVGDVVSKGEQIAEVGNSGKSTGPHVHFEVHYQGTQIDPKTILKN